MYKEVDGILKKIEYLLNNELELFKVSELESLLFNFYNEGYYRGMSDAFSDYDSKFLENIGIKTRI